ncbi:MAG: Holliday junction resolvase RuvX [Gammaproteobacteria bacterium]|nr:MAG: Holliday junction resolvase RuvX [Gammaproteobacteria bacterium]
MATLIGIDYGHKKIGFATGQTITASAAPLTIIAQNGEMWPAIDRIMQEWQPDMVIIGEPKLADGKPHPLEKKIQRFITAIKQRYDVTVKRVDEAYTSFEATRYQRGQGRQSILDAHAAAILLESWMRENS